MSDTTLTSLSASSSSTIGPVAIRAGVELGDMSVQPQCNAICCNVEESHLTCWQCWRMRRAECSTMQHNTLQFHNAMQYAAIPQCSRIHRERQGQGAQYGMCWNSSRPNCITIQPLCCISQECVRRRAMLELESNKRKYCDEIKPGCISNLTFNRYQTWQFWLLPSFAR